MEEDRSLALSGLEVASCLPIVCQVVVLQGCQTHVVRVLGVPLSCLVPCSALMSKSGPDLLDGLPSSFDLHAFQIFGIVALLLALGPLAWMVALGEDDALASPILLVLQVHTEVEARARKDLEHGDASRTCAEHT